MITIIVLIIIAECNGFPLKEVSQDVMAIILAIGVASDLNFLTRIFAK